MEKTKIATLLFVAALVAGLLATTAAAIAIAPGSVDILFEPNSEKVFNIRIINNDASTEDVTLYVKGGLASYLDFPEQTIKMKPNELKIISAKLKLPGSLPADPTVRIGASVFAGPSVVAAVESTITIKSPSTEAKGTAARIEILGVSITRALGSTRLDISIKNTGNTGTEVYAEANLNSDAGNGNLKTDSKKFGAGQQQTLSAPLTGVLAQTKNYTADVVIYYGQNTVKKSVRISNGITGGSVFSLPVGFGSDASIIAAIILFVVIDALVLFWHKNRTY